MEEKSPGLLLQTVPYLGNQKILKIFTPHAGLISLIAKKTQKNALLTPFCLGEWVFRKNAHHDLYVLLDSSLSNPFLKLRGHYKTLCAAGQIGQDLLKNHLPGLYAADLFNLACLFFEYMPSFEHPEILPLLFRLKWLQKEGLFSFQSHCCLCQKNPSCHIHDGQCYCFAHALEPGWTFKEEEWKYFTCLLSARRLSEIKNLKEMKGLDYKIELFFQERIRR